MNYQELKTELEKAEYEGLDAAQCVEILNANDGTTRVYVNREDAVNWLLKNGVWDKLEQASTNSAYPEILRARIRTFFATLQNISLLNFENFEGDIPTLVGAGVITQGDADGFMALSYQLVPRWSETVTETDVNIARNQDALAEVQTLLERAATGHGSTLELLQGVQAQLRAGEVANVPSIETIKTKFGEAFDE